MRSSAIAIVLFLSVHVRFVFPQTLYLNPPYFNIVEGRNITASATCGEKVAEKEMYCKLVGANWFENPHAEAEVVDGQACDYCFDKDPKLNHNIENAIDGTEKRWQSPPLARGIQYEKINITISLGQEFHVAYIYLKMGNAPRPDVWILERSRDNGKTYTPWQYFASSKEECAKRFGRQTTYPITKDDSVICETKFSKLVPLEGGEIVVPLINDRPNADNFSLSKVLQDWTSATNIRLRLLKPKTTLGIKSAGFKNDPTVTRRYYYSIKEINVGGRCVCNGHANTCDVKDENRPRLLYCNCVHNTCGPQCEQCCPGFVQRKWKPATINDPNECEECNCHDHSSECVYNETVDMMRLSLDKYGRKSGGGVCLNCQHNTDGINCHKCKPKFYRPFNRPLNAINVCEPCNCDETFSTGLCLEGSGRCECKKQYLAPNCNKCSPGYYDFPNCRECDCFVNGTVGSVCEIGGGQCPCKDGYTGQYCRGCSQNFYGFPDCKPCGCLPTTSVSPVCESASGNCSCKYSFGGRKCDTCDVGFYKYPQCDICNCDRTGTTDDVCNNVTGQCLCKPGYGGPRCDKCDNGFFGYPNCTPCECDKTGSAGSDCQANGRCYCKRNFGGFKCSKCAPGYHKFPECLNCECDYSGSKGITCDDNGQCNCKDNFDGEKCNKCKQNYYNFPLCEQCNCNPSGVLPTFAGCGSLTTGELCECKERVTGRQCHLCKSLFWNLKRWNPLGCDPCNCHLPGTVSGLESCNGGTGQCICKENVKGRSCSECVEGTYALSENRLFGCQDCNCNLGGAISNVCNKLTGQCYCKPRLTGRKCDRVIRTHYFPTLYQHQYEMEEGFSPSETPARFNYQEDAYPNFSWKGYANFSELQQELILNINIDKERLFRPIFNYVNLGNEPVKAKLVFTPEFDEDPQSVSILFEPTAVPKLLILAGQSGVVIPPLVLSSGNWKASLKVEGDLLVDYMVLLPQNYYEATILRDPAPRVCEVNAANVSRLCRQYAYPEFRQDTLLVKGDSGYSITDGRQVETQTFDDFDVSQIGLHSSDRLAKLNGNTSLRIGLKLVPSEPYVFVLIYSTPNKQEESDTQKAIYLNFTAKSGEEIFNGLSVLSRCPYTFTCRQVVKSAQGEPMVFAFNSSEVKIDLSVTGGDGLGIYGVVALPRNEWSMDYVIPTLVCTMKNAKCVESSFVANIEAVKLEVEKSLRAEDADESSHREVEGDGFSKPTLIFGKEGSSITVEGNVPKSGTYTFVLHYYQPTYPSFELSVTMQSSNGLFSIKHCPSKMGCRSLLYEKDTNSISFNIAQDFSFILQNPNNRSVGLDYILIVPSELYSSDLLRLQVQEKASDFIKQCGQNAFYISSNSSKFCRNSVFALTTDYNNGALPCKCNPEGSLKYECDEFGGQCPCKPNIIGRTCSSCKIGHYGFPQCKPCNCPSSAVCHQQTGACMCPPRVTGQKCDTCKELTYGFHAVLGCQECNCDTRGVDSGNRQCHLVTGNCTCKPNIIGRTCNTCKRGYTRFPYCTLCDCDISGTTEEICSKETGQCFCKKNVYGDACDQCLPGSYYLQESNPYGCTKCFCFTTTDKCRSSELSVLPINDMANKEWSVVKLSIDSNGVHQTTIEDSITINFLYNQVRAVLSEPSRGDNPPKTANATGLYFAAPSSYLGKRVTSYGLNISYLIQDMVVVPEYEDSQITPDLIIVGNNMTIIHENTEQPPDPSTHFAFNFSLTEKNFKRLDGGKMTREQMMMVLVNLEAIYIRGSYFEPAVEVHLIDFVLESTSEEYVRNSRLALSVEQCFCPRNYKGTSCEECAPGYFRAKTGPYLGYCVPCRCHGHADECDVETGKCLNCKHNTMGDHCEKCSAGYHGDATTGSPHACLICACPLPIESNNFATSCEIREGTFGLSEIKCVCKEGYHGPNCNVCDNGYYGRPTVQGEYCKPCECHGNINASQVGSCDSETGRCIKCLHNTSGPACEICRPWFHGDAISKKDCKSCKCDKTGTSNCDSQTGVCQCFPNVTGESCDECLPNHWDFASRRGCRPCNCGLASINGSCNIQTGQCFCQPGVTGQTCSYCKPGHWKYSEIGCQSCNCTEKFSDGTGCDELTGQCKCLPGVIGEKCDSCPPRWVFIKKERCEECDSCVDFLLDDTDMLPSMIDPTLKEMRLASKSVYAYRRLTNANKTVDEYKNKITQMVESPQTDLSSLEASVIIVEEQRDIVAFSADQNLTRAEKLATSALNKTREAFDVKKSVENAVEELQSVFNDLKNLDSLAKQQKTDDEDKKIAEIERIVSFLNQSLFSDDQTRTKEEKDAANGLLKKVEDFKYPSIASKYNITFTLEMLEKIMNTTISLGDYNKKSLETSIKAETIHEQTNKIYLDSFQPRVTRISDTETEANKTLDEAKKLIEESVNSIAPIDNKLVDITNFIERVKLSNQTLQKKNEQIPQDIEDLRPKVIEAKRCADRLKEGASNLHKGEESWRNASKSAVDAAHSYERILNAMENSSSAAEAANESANEAKRISEGNYDNALQSKTRSLALKKDALNLQIQVASKLEIPLNSSIEEVTKLEKNLSYARRRLENIRFEELSNKKLHSKSEKVKQISQDTNILSERTNEGIDELLVRIDNAKNKAKNVPTEYDKISDSIRIATSFAEKASLLVPNITERLTTANATNMKLTSITDEMSARIEELKAKISYARGVANRIEVAGEFFETSHLQLQNPNILEDSKGHTKLSLYFKTKRPDGLLAYIGNPIQNQQSDSGLNKDFMALEIRGGKIVLTTDVGYGAEEIRNEKYIATDEWNQVTFEKIGKIVTLKVRDSKETITSGGPLKGSSIVFDLDDEHSKIFIGGVPPSVQIQNEVENKQYVGYIEGVVLGDTPLGLWNFAKSKNVMGAASRENMQTASSNGAKFDGSSYVLLPLTKGKQYISTHSFINLRFKTHAEEGLLYLVGGVDSYLSVFIKDGNIHLLFGNGNGVEVIKSSKKFNDGNWHYVESSRSVSEGEMLLIVDNSEIGNGAKFAKNVQLQTNDSVYIGGYPKEHSYSFVTNVDFTGCIKDFQVGNQIEDILKNGKASPSVVNGCPEAPVRVAMFDNTVEQTSYVQFALNESINERADITLRFKTTIPKGLLFYSSNEDYSSYLAVFIEDGALVMKAQPGGEVRTSKGRLYNNDAWHFVNAKKDQQQIRISVDDNDVVVTDSISNAVELTNLMYFGGVPGDYVSQLENANFPLSFNGCIGDVTVNDKPYDFSMSSKRENVKFVTCNNFTEPPPPVTTTTTTSTTTSTTTTTTTTTSTSVTTNGCILPLIPDRDPDVSVVDGVRFGGSPFARHEFRIPASVTSSLMDESSFSISFKTDGSDADGVLFYVTSEGNIDFVGLYMQNGRILLSFNCGSGPALIVSEKMYNDSNWHTVVIIIRGRNGTLKIISSDNVIEQVFGHSSGQANSMNVKSPIFVGGLSEKVAPVAKNKLKGITQSFPGCIKDLHVQAEKYQFGINSVEYDLVQLCSSKVESGTFFHGNGFVSVYDDFRVGQRIAMSLKIKPRNVDGVIMAVHGKVDYMILQMIDGTVNLTANNGAGSFNTAVKFTEKHFLCDGRWHTVEVYKEGNMVTVSVDSQFAEPGWGVGGVYSTDTTSPMYIGGVPEKLEIENTTVSIPELSKSVKNFVGCMRELSIDKATVPMSTARVYGSVNPYTCSTL